MSRDKQIEEMCEVLRKNAVSCKTCNWYAEGLCIGNCELAEDNQTVCETLYNAGYRKSTDVAEEIFAEIDDFQRTLRHIFLNMCGGNDYNTLNLLQIDNAIEALFDSRIAELKKKYTESGRSENGKSLRSFRNAVEENKTIKKSLKEAQATAEEWKRKYLEMLDVNIRLAEKIKNREET